VNESRDTRHGVRTEARFRVRRASVYALVAVVALSVASLLWRPGRDGQSPEASAYSYSAIGHHGFARWLTEIGVPNRIAAARPTRDLGPGDTLAIIAPDPCETDTSCHRFSYNIRRAIEADANVLVVLPRWTAVEDENRASIAERVEILAQEEIAEVLARTMIAARFALKPYEIETLLAEELWFEGALGALGQTSSPGAASRSSAPNETWLLALESVQVLSDAYATELEPVVTLPHSNEILVGRVRGTRVFVMTDPTPFANAALADADHADLIAWLLFEELGTRSIVIDETAHVHGRPPRVWDALFVMPLIPLTVHVLLVFLMLLWMASIRFQLPVDSTADRPRGSSALLASAAALLEEGAAGGQALATYWEMTVRDVARAYSLPPALSHAERLSRLQALETKPEVGVALRALDDRVGRLETLSRRRAGQFLIVSVAIDIHQFGKSHTHGYSTH